MLPFDSLSTLDDPHRHSIDVLAENLQKYHMQLSIMADQKAQILLGVSSLLATFAINQLLLGNLTWSITGLLGAMIGAIVPAVMAIAPSVAAPQDNQPKQGLINPLFFGSYAHLTPTEFLEEMNTIIHSNDEIYKAMVMNAYYNGRVMADRKYSLITISYRIFLVGIVVGTAMAVIETAM